MYSVICAWVLYAFTGLFSVVVRAGGALGGALKSPEFVVYPSNRVFFSLLFLCKPISLNLVPLYSHSHLRVLHLRTGFLQTSDRFL